MMKIKGRKKGRGRRSTNLGTDWPGFELEFIMGIMIRTTALVWEGLLGMLGPKLIEFFFGI